MEVDDIVGYETLRHVMGYAMLCECVQMVGQAVGDDYIYKLSRFLSTATRRQYCALPEKTRRLCNNRTVSAFHAAAISSLAAYYWLFYVQDYNLPKTAGNYEAYCIDMMMGYLVYDFLFELFFGGATDTMAHHVLGLASHLSSRLTMNGAAAYYCMIIFLAETSTPFLHTSWLLHTMERTDSMAFKVCAGMLLLTFFVFRVVLGTFMVVHMYLHRMEWGDGYTGNFFDCHWAVVIVFALLNYFWFYKLIAVVIKNGKGTGKDKKEKRGKEGDGKASEKDKKNE